MSMLYTFSLEENYTEFRDLLIRSGPTATPLLGWLVGTGFYDSDPKGKCSIWTSHPDPFHCNDPVVWIFDSKHRVRVFVTSEVVLDLGTFTPEAIELAKSPVYEDKVLPNYFVEPQLEVLYNQSKEILGGAMKTYMEIHEGEVLFHGVNLLWSPVFQQVLDVDIYSPCFKFVKPMSSFEDKNINLPHDLKMDRLEENNIQQVHSSNKIPYDFNYIGDCFRISSAIKRIDNDALVAWGMTHRDFTVGALHVLPEYRRKGYADVILQDLCKQYVAFYKDHLPNNTSEIYFSSVVENYNTSSANLFKKTGWTSFGLGSIWIFGSKKVSCLNSI